MSEPMLISPLLDGYLVGEPISEHHGIRCCPAVHEESNEKCIVKILSLPASAEQVEALVLAGAFPDDAAAISYFESRIQDYTQEIEILQQLSRQEGFMPLRGYQHIASEEHVGFDLYMLADYRRSLAKHIAKNPMTHLEAMNLTLDICSALTACRRSGYLYTNLKPSNIFRTANGEFCIADIGFTPLSGLKYASLRDNCIHAYTPPEIEDAYSTISDNMDVYALGMILYEIFNGGKLPADKSADLELPKYADEELSEIIMKACNPDPALRWQDPAQMGQMVVNYIQKNGTHDTPVVPKAPEDTTPDELSAVSEEITAPQEAEEETVYTQDNAVPADELSEAVDNGDLSADVAAVEESSSDYDNEENTEVSIILENADDQPAEENEPAEIIMDAPAQDESVSENAVDEIAHEEDVAESTDGETVEEDISSITTDEPAADSIDDQLAFSEFFDSEVAADPQPASQQDPQDEVLQSDSVTEIEESPENEASALPEVDEALSSIEIFTEDANDASSGYQIPEIELPDISQEADDPAAQPEDDAAIIDSQEAIIHILEEHDAFQEEADKIKAAAVYLELDQAPDDPSKEYYSGVSDEVSKILSQADELVATDVPQPAVSPEAIAVELPVEEATDGQPVDDAADGQPVDDATEDKPVDDDPNTPLHYAEDDTDMKSNEQNESKKSHLVRNLIIILILLLLLAGGVLFYFFYVQQTVDSIEVTGTKDQLIVQVSTEANEDLLSVSCQDKYGTITVPVYQGVAHFTGLRPDSDYEITVNISGIHILKGNTEESYRTPTETVLVSHSVFTGDEPGSAILNFTVEGPTSEKWSFTYSTPGYPEQTVSFSGTSVTLNDLLPNKSYSGILTPETDLFITSDMQIQFSASEVIQAQNLRITGCSGGKLTVQWDAPEGITVDNWTVRCYSGKDGATYDQTVTTSKTSHEFKQLNSLEAFTVEVTAVGQTMVQKVSIPANSVTITKLTADASQDGIINLKWESGSVPKDGWVITYTIAGSDKEVKLAAKEKSAIIVPVVPNTEYTITVQSADDVHTFCQSVSCMTKATSDFTITVNDKPITVSDLQFSLFKQPTDAQWDHTNLNDSSYTNSFSKTDKAGILIYLQKQYEESTADFSATFVITDSEGKITDVSSQISSWDKAWDNNYCIFKLPSLPITPGYYTLTLYLNSQQAYEIAFQIQ